MKDALAIYSQFDQIESAAIAMQQSGYFKDVTSKQQAIVKVMAGAELGLPPFASMTGIHIIQGKPILGANVLATLVKNDPRYNYKIKQCDNKACIIAWQEDGKTVGESSFTWDEAKGAGLVGKDNWKKYPSDMLFARAISRGTRRYAPGVFGGSPVYTPDEFGVEVDPEGYIEATVLEASGTGTADTPEEERWSIDHIDAILDANLAENVPNARNMLNLSDLPKDCEVQLAVDWGKSYRMRRDTGKDTKTAAAETNEGLAKMLANGRDYRPDSPDDFSPYWEYAHKHVSGEEAKLIFNGAGGDAQAAFDKLEKMLANG